MLWPSNKRRYLVLQHRELGAQLRQRKPAKLLITPPYEFVGSSFAGSMGEGGSLRRSPPAQHSGGWRQATANGASLRSK